MKCRKYGTLWGKRGQKIGKGPNLCLTASETSFLCPKSLVKLTKKLPTKGYPLIAHYSESKVVKMANLAYFGLNSPKMGHLT